MEIKRFERLEPVSPLVPPYKFALGFVDLSDKIDFGTLTEYFLKQEKMLMEKTPESHDDGGTGLGPNSVTSKYPFYTIWMFDQTQQYKILLKQQIDIYMTRLRLPVEQRVYGQGWFNVLRNGQKINRHNHAGGDYAYLSAHLTIAAKNTSTVYFNNFTNEYWEEENVPGQLTIFPSWVDHCTTAVADDEPRISLAFDFLSKEGYLNVDPELKWRWQELK